jgi:hypothetical protein
LFESTGARSIQYWLGKLSHDHAQRMFSGTKPSSVYLLSLLKKGQ